MRLQQFYDNIGVVPTIIICIAVMLFLGFAMTRITKLLKLPNVTAYIITGLILGPFALDLIPTSVVDGLDFLPDIALAFVAFNAGEYFKLSALKKNGIKACIITICMTIVVCALSFILMFLILKLDIKLSLLIAAIAATVSPTATLMIIKQTGAKGEFVDNLLQTIGVSNLITILLFSIINAIVSPNISQIDVLSILIPIGKSLACLVIGGIFGFFLKLLMPKKRTTDNRLIICIATLFLFCAISALLNTSPLLGCMSMGMVYINITDDKNMFKQLSYFSPPILLLFFVRSGLKCNIGSLFLPTSIGFLPLIIVVILYVVIRIIGMFSGSLLGAIITKKDSNVKKYLGISLLPQSSVAIGLAALGARTLTGELGESLNTIIVAACVIFEIIGPAITKLCLTLSKSYENIEEVVQVNEKDANGKVKTEVEILIERIQKIQTELPKHEPINEEEQAFTEASLEQFQTQENFRNNRMFRRNRK